MDQRWNQSLPLRKPDYHGGSPRDAIDRRGGGRRSLDQQSPFLGDGRGRYNSQSQRERPGRLSTESVTLEDGVVDLFHAVNDAIQQFGHFEQDYDRDVQRIRSYCDKELIEAVWMQKLAPRAISRDRQRERYGGPDERDKAEHQPLNLRGTMKQLLSTLGAALHAAEDFRPSQRRPSRYSPDDVSEVRQYLHKAYHSLRKSFSTIVEHRSKIGKVNTELEMLRVFLSRNGAEESGERGGTVRFQASDDPTRGGESDFQGQGSYHDDSEQGVGWSPSQADGQG
ncbi:MAG: hypothetical protein Q9201_000391 [Fulgogasparrea decipioides]